MDENLTIMVFDQKEISALHAGSLTYAVDHVEIIKIMPYKELNGEIWFAVYGADDEITARINSRFVHEVSY